MLLYYVPGACSLAPHILLREAGLPFELRKVDFANRRLEDGTDYGRINPKGYIPALELDSGERLTETSAILQYIADQRPQAQLAPPAGTLARYRMLEWLSFTGAEIHKGFAPLFNPQSTPEWRSGAKGLLERRLDWLAGAVRAEAYLVGETFTAADAYLYVALSWCGYVGMTLARWPALERYSQHVGRRPKVQEALRAEHG